MRRQFFPGSEWLYIKLYTNEINSNSIIIKIAEAIESDAKTAEYIKQWFYIRYADPETHIRIRILQTDKADLFRTLSFIYNSIEYEIRNSIIWKVQLDTYTRELERYGEENIELSENIFCLESCVIPKLLKLEDENLLLYASIWCIDKYLDILNFDLKDKINILQHMSESFNNEFHVHSKSINCICQNYKQSVEKVIENIGFNGCRESLKPFLDNFIALQTEHLQTIRTYNITNDAVSGHIHMLNNRLFISDNRKYELVIYNLLFKYYKSREIRNKISQS